MNILFVVNNEGLTHQNLFPCKSNKLKKFLVERKGINYISRTVDEATNKITWYFSDTSELDEALLEWKANKNNGTFAFPK